MSAAGAFLGQATTDQTVTEALGTLQTILQYVGTVAFGISGALVAGQKRMDLAGVVVLGCIVAVGGGTTRDLLLGNVPVFWVNDATYVLVGAAAALVTVPLFRTGTVQTLQQHNLVDVFDAAGMALFVITGTNVALSAGASNFSAAIIGVISGVGGGMIRDVLAGQIPGVLKSGHLYATAAFAGALLYVLLLELSIAPIAALWVPAFAIFSIRMLSLRYGWGIPKFDVSDQ
jgi:uncharacterized membrane protein YeiH